MTYGWTDERRHHQPLISRRQILAGTAAAGLGWAAAPGWALASRTRQVPAPAAAARNVILFVVDGMAMGTLSLADHYRRYTEGKTLEWYRLANTPGAHRALQTTQSADSVVTDSAAASSAWSTGVKHLNGSLSVAPDGRALTPMLARARAGGKATACVTTTTITHATPAGFYANHADRDKQAAIGAQLVERPVDLAMGGGSKYVPVEKARAAGCRVLTSRAELRAADATLPGRSMGVYSEGHIPFALDRAESDVTLADLAGFALKSLEAASRGPGFFLQIEAGRVDHAAHDNDAGAILREMLEADALLAVLAEWVAGRPDTLLIATTDHATANPAPTWYGVEGVKGLKKLAEARHSLEWVEEQFKAQKLPKDPAAQTDALVKLVEQAAGFTLKPDDVKLIKRFFAGERVQAFATANTPLGVLGGVLASHTGVAFLSPNHTSDHTELLALGPASERVAGMLDNTDVHRLMVESLGLPASI